MSSTSRMARRFARPERMRRILRSVRCIASRRFFTACSQSVNRDTILLALINFFVLFTYCNIWKLSITLCNPLCSLYKGLGVVGPFHIVTILTARTTILCGVRLARIQTINSINSNSEVDVLTVNTLGCHHSLGLFIRQMPLNATPFSCKLYSIQSCVHMSPIPFSCIIWIFRMPLFHSIIILLTILFWSFFELSFTPFDIISFFILKFVVVFTPFWFRIKLLPLLTTLQTS